jgi:CIC family chloride channel protein
MHFDIFEVQSVYVLVMLLCLKGLASMISLGAGFRGGLFFASLLLGAIVGRLFAQSAALLLPLSIDPAFISIVGMAALGTGVIGAPVTMTVLALEMTGDFPVTASALVACAITSLLVRELFGYSFATWRFHLRGETIRGPHDIGWIRDLTAERLMRRDVHVLPLTTSIDAARAAYPLGATRHIFLTDGTGHYAGIVLMGDLYAAADPLKAVASLAMAGQPFLVPSMTIREILDAFERYESDVLPVLTSPEEGRVIGLVTEAHALRRYGEELERRNRDIAPR